MQWNGTNLILVSNCALDIFQISRRRSTYSPQRQRTFMSSRIDGPNLQTLSILQLPREREGNCTPSEKRPWRIMCGKDDVTPASERAVYALPPCYYFLMAITTHDNKHDQRFNANVRLGCILGVRHRGTFIALRIWVCFQTAC